MVLSSGRSPAAVAAGLTLVATLVLAAPDTAFGQSSIGFTGGVSIDPEQVYAGVFWQSPDLGGRFRLRPGLDGGFGQGLRLATFNIDFVYLLPLGQSPWSLVAGGGPTIVLTRLSEDVPGVGTDVGAGLTWLFGFTHEKGFLVDIRVGGGRTPGLKAGAGWAVKF